MADTKVKTGKVRFSYAHVFEPTSMQEGQDKKYSVSILIPKTDTATITRIKAAIEEAKELGKGKWNNVIPKNLKTPLRDGDEEREGDEAYAGHFFIGANSTMKPGIVDKDRQPIISADEFYSGCFGRASINFYAYNASGSKGIAAGLNNLQKLEDGARLSGGGASAADDFGDDDDLL